MTVQKISSICDYVLEGKMNGYLQYTVRQASKGPDASRVDVWDIEHIENK